MPTVVFVCTANICRSPVAEALFADWLRKQNVPGEWQVGSAGTWADPGEAVSPYSREVLGERGLDLSRHRARRIDRAMVEGADLLVCMTRSQCEALRAEFPRLAGRVQLLSALSGPAFDISDPYGGPRDGYVAMVEEVELLLEAGGARIIELAGPRAEPAAGGASPEGK